MGASALDVAGVCRLLAAVASDRGEADDHGGLFGRQGADLGKADDQRDRGDGSDAGDGSQDGKPPGEARVGADQASISAPRFSIAVSAARIWRLISTAAGRAVVAPSWLRRVVRAAASGLRLSQRIASIRQSTRSVLAKAPKASANSRERNGFPPRLQTQRGPRSRPPDPWGWPPPGIDPSQSDSGSLFIQCYDVKLGGGAAPPEGLGVALRKGAGKRGPKRLKTLDGAGKIAVRRARA